MRNTTAVQLWTTHTTNWIVAPPLIFTLKPISNFSYSYLNKKNTIWSIYDALTYMLRIIELLVFSECLFHLFKKSNRLLCSEIKKQDNNNQIPTTLQFSNLHWPPHQFHKPALTHRLKQSHMLQLDLGPTENDMPELRILENILFK